MSKIRFRPALGLRQVRPMLWSGWLGWVLASALITGWGVWRDGLRPQDFVFVSVRLMPIFLLANFAGWSLMIRFGMVNTAGFAANAVALGALLAGLQAGASALGIRAWSFMDAFILGVLIWLSMWIVFSITYLFDRSSDGEEDAAASEG